MYMCTHSTSINNVYMRSVCTCRETANVSKFGSRLGTGSTCMESLFITLLLPYNMPQYAHQRRCSHVCENM